MLEKGLGPFSMTKYNMFLGHKNELTAGQWKVLPQHRLTQTLVNTDDCFRLQNNICPHQGSRIREGTGVGLSAVCPYHGWSWDQQGEPRGSGTVGHSNGSAACANTYRLSANNVHEWSGFLFESNIPSTVDLSGNYELVEYRLDHIAAGHVPIMDLFLDIDHIPLVHPKLYDLIDVPNVKNVKWETWDNGSMQLVFGVPGTNADWTKDTSNTGPECSAAWLAVYPYTMFEWQPGAVFVMVNQPVDDQNTVTHVFKYRDLNYSESHWAINSQVWETAWQQDRAQAERLEPGWRMVENEHMDNEKVRYRDWLKTYK